MRMSLGGCAIITEPRVTMTGKHPKGHERPDVDEYGRTTLHYAAAEADEGKVAALLASGFDPAAPDANGWTPLHCAA